MFHPEGPTFAELARQALSSVERGYDLLAPKFDRTPYRTPDALILPALAAVTRAVAPAPPSPTSAPSACASAWGWTSRRECSASPRPR